MGKKNVVIDINSIANTKLKMDSECEKLIGMLNKYKTMFEETKAIYDTESATIYRKIADAYIDYVLKYINNDLKPFIGSLDDIKILYIDEISAIAKEVGGTE